ncbi:unnamed protein product [Caenorhabditis sp. 36 PRJEB53466]|nr:unnamed protein product [Caenorhabditis sp. 36 PRJEB53466]
MVEIIGWTPSEKGGNRDGVLNRFITPFRNIIENEHDYPRVRSGHRCFTDNDYFYVLGGYTSAEGGRIFKEVWAMSLATFEWRRYEAKGSMPSTLASFAIIQLHPFSKSFLLFGGSGTRFGTSSSNRLYLAHVDNENCTVEFRKLKPEGDIPRPIYGHAMCAGEIAGKYYIVGGTEGSVFNFKVYSLTVKENPEAEEDDEKFTWRFELKALNEDLPGRYRLETVYDEKSDCLLFFGGGNAAEIFDFNKIAALHVTTNECSEITTVADPQAGFPVGRRCHTLVRHHRKVIITGGVHKFDEDDPQPLHSDVWIFDLDTFSWTKFAYSLPQPVFFHDSAITSDGWLLTFGGVHGRHPQSPRSNVLICSWFDVPSLRRFAVEALRSSRPKLFSGLYGGNLCPSQAHKLIMLCLKIGSTEENEKLIIEQKQIKFHEREDRTRHYLNEDAANFLVSHGTEPDNERIHARRLQNLRNRLNGNLERDFLDNHQLEGQQRELARVGDFRALAPAGIPFHLLRRGWNELIEYGIGRLPEVRDAVVVDEESGDDEDEEEEDDWVDLLEDLEERQDGEEERDVDQH